MPTLQIGKAGPRSYYVYDAERRAELHRQGDYQPAVSKAAVARFSTREEAEAYTRGQSTRSSFAMLPERAAYIKPTYDVTDVDTGKKLPPKEPSNPRKDGPTAVYVVDFIKTWDGETLVRKIGVTADTNRSRYALTVGLSVKEVLPPQTYPTRGAAELAARGIEALYDADDAWVRVGAEVFRPT